MVDILDHRGQKIDRKALTEPQTAKIAQLHQEFANHPTRGLTPSRLAQILEDAERGDLTAQCDLFEDMEEKDGHIMAELGKRKRAILGLEWNIKPPKNAKAEEEKQAALVQEIIEDIPNFEDVLLDMADAIGYGYACLEIEWGKHRYYYPKKIDRRPPGWFKTHRESRDQLRLRNNTEHGAELIQGGWITHIHKAKSGYVARAGLHRALCWPFLFKNYSVRDLAEFLEIYGLPVRLGQYPRGATDGEKATLLRAVVNMGHAAAGIIPEGMMVEFKEAAKGASDPYEAMLTWCEKTQSKVILGGTLTSQADGASSTNALGNVHNEVRRDLMISDVCQIAGTLTRDLIRTICLFNGLQLNDLRCPKFEFDTVEAEDLALYAGAIPKLVTIGMPVPVSYVRDKLRIPEPEGNEPILTQTQKQEQPAALAALKNETQALQDPTPTESHTDLLQDNTVDALEGWLAVLRKKIDDADDLEALKQDLIESYGDLDTDKMAAIMQMAFAAAELAGRFDVDQGE